jgi:hypothetical protein
MTSIADPVFDGKIGAFERRPDGGGLYKIFRADDAVDYWAGE